MPTMQLSQRWRAMRGYVTDGVHLYEIEGYERNYGLIGGIVWLVRDCITETIRRVWPIEQALCEPVTRSDA